MTPTSRGTLVITYAVTKTVVVIPARAWRFRDAGERGWIHARKTLRRSVGFHFR